MPLARLGALRPACPASWFDKLTMRPLESSSASPEDLILSPSKDEVLVRPSRDRTDRTPASMPGLMVRQAHHEASGKFPCLPRGPHPEPVEGRGPGMPLARLGALRLACPASWFDKLTMRPPRKP